MRRTPAEIEFFGSRSAHRSAGRQQPHAPLLHSRLMGVDGTWQREGDVMNLIAGRIEDLTPLLGRLTTESRDFH
jgi:error-prone DNA polymerase